MYSRYTLSIEDVRAIVGLKKLKKRVCENRNEITSKGLVARERTRKKNNGKIG